MRAISTVPGRVGGAALPRRTLVGLAAFAALTALAGGIEMLVWPDGNRYLPIRLIEHTPFTTFLVPGLLLAIVVGGTSLACAWLTWRRSPAAVDATLLAGGTLTGWILAEAGMMRDVHWLHGIYGATGAAILWLGLRAAWRGGSPRHRWVITVTLAEAIGFLVPASAGVLSAEAGLTGPRQAGLLVAAGVVEGLVLGAGQAWAFPFRVRRLRYALLTALGAGLVWLAVMLLVEERPATVEGTALAGVATGLIGLTAIGAAQWIELRRHAGAAQWIGWTALAWAAALPLSFTPGPFVDESTPLASHLVLWGCGGLLMALVLALVTWQGVRRLASSLHQPRGMGVRREAHPAPPMLPAEDLHVGPLADL